jgi:UPF0271 protein
MRSIDINCDMGEGFGNYRTVDDKALLPWITSANLACGFHAGDPSVMKEAVQLCVAAGVRIGAHPGLPDLQGFGRRQMSISAREAYDMTVYQIGALYGFVVAEGVLLQHVKPHGALYHMATHNKDVAEAIVNAVYKVNPDLYIMAPAYSEMFHAAERLGLRIAKEAFADRAYQEDGRLVPRDYPGAVIHDTEQAAEQAVRIIQTETVTTLNGLSLQIEADTLCIHGDHDRALPILRAIRIRLDQEGIQVASLS